MRPSACSTAATLREPGWRSPCPVPPGLAGSRVAHPPVTGPRRAGQGVKHGSQGHEGQQRAQHPLERPMTSLGLWVLGSAVALTVYTYLGYPVLLLLFGVFRR